VIEGTYAHVLGSVSSDGSFQLSAASEDTLAKVAIAGIRPTLWGDPSDESHDAQRGDCVFAGRTKAKCTLATRNHKAFLTLPTKCSGPLVTEARADSWLQQGLFVSRSYESTDLDGSPVGISGCGQLGFSPSITSKATTSMADSPSGLTFDLHQPQSDSYEGLANANLRDATVTLPPGMTLNPAAGNGLSACSPEQIGLTTGVNQTPIRFQEGPSHCPDAAKIGTVVGRTPLIDHPLPGAVYLAKPFDNPFGSLLALYLVLEDPQSGLIAKLAGKAEADPVTGQLTTRFIESPDLPLEDVELQLFGGARGALTTPLTCGTKTTTSVLAPWSDPEGQSSGPTDSYDISSAPGGACVDKESQAPLPSSFTAGTVSPVAGAYSPFVLNVDRPDGSQRITAINTTLPKGLVGRLAGTPYCSDAQIAAATARSQPNEGAVEVANPSCPAASEVGTADVGAGSGSNPIHVQGHVYLAGPYKGAPLSIVIITPAIAGPFDLGTVVVRASLYVDLFTAEVSVKSDPLPTILDGIPLDVRSIAVKIAKPTFTLNPTSCDPMAVKGEALTSSGAASLMSRFQVGQCDKLGFKPSLKIKLSGSTKRSGHPALKAVLTYPQKGQYANVAKAQVGLPHSEFLDQGNLDKVCKQADLKAGTCPKRSIYGKAKAWTPLLDKPLEGPVYLGVGFGYKLPALVADLDGQIRVLLKGKVDTTKQDGLRNTFEAVPDAPVSRFVLEMKGGTKYGLLENSENVCRKPQKASVNLVAQTGKTSHTMASIANDCKSKKKGKKNHGKKQSKSDGG
jgi:hypothetical protein